MNPSSQSLAGKVIIVTGSTDGIGLAIAKQCALEGAKVVVHGLELDRVQKVANSLSCETAHCAADLVESTAPHAIIEEAVSKFGTIDGLVNNAGWSVRSNIDSTDTALFDRVMTINARAPLMLIQEALPHLKKNRGAVVNIGSLNAYTGEPRLLAYAMSKAALMALSRNLANSLAGDHVRFNHFNLGWVLTENERKLKISEGLPEDWGEHPDLEHVPTGKMTSPEEVARHAVFWLSNESRPISGSVIDMEQYPVIGRIPLKEGTTEGRD
jgi:NAD(P)-dependent dehydrogenase (short-subunit alcohol dehydrogenase family)